MFHFLFLVIRLVYIFEGVLGNDAHYNSYTGSYGGVAFREDDVLCGVDAFTTMTVYFLRIVWGICPRDRKQFAHLYNAQYCNVNGYQSKGACYYDNQKCIFCSGNMKEYIKAIASDICEWDPLVFEFYYIDHCHTQGAESEEVCEASGPHCKWILREAQSHVCMLDRDQLVEDGLGSIPNGIFSSIRSAGINYSFPSDLVQDLEANRNKSRHSEPQESFGDYLRDGYDNNHSEYNYDLDTEYDDERFHDDANTDNVDTIYTDEGFYNNDAGSEDETHSSRVVIPNSAFPKSQQQYLYLAWMILFFIHHVLSV